MMIRAAIVAFLLLLTWVVHGQAPSGGFPIITLPPTAGCSQGMGGGSASVSTGNCGGYGKNSIAYIGCSNSADTMNGYSTFPGALGRMWPSYHTFFGRVALWMIDGLLWQVDGTPTVGDTVSWTITNANIVGSPVTVTYTVQIGDTTKSIATGLAAAVNNNANLTGAPNGGVGAAAGSNNSIFGAWDPIAWSPRATYSFSVSGAASEIIDPFTSISAVENPNIGPDDGTYFYWYRFDLMVQNFGVPKEVWVQYCESGNFAAEPSSDSVTMNTMLLNHTQNCASWSRCLNGGLNWGKLKAYLTSIDDYQSPHPLNDCSLMTVGGVQGKGVTDTKAWRLANADNVNFFLATILGPLTVNDVQVDHCHPNVAGSLLLAGQLSTWADNPH